MTKKLHIAATIASLFATPALAERLASGVEVIDGGQWCGDQSTVTVIGALLVADMSDKTVHCLVQTADPIFAVETTNAKVWTAANTSCGYQMRGYATPHESAFTGDFKVVLSETEGMTLEISSKDSVLGTVSEQKMATCDRHAVAR